MEITNKTNCHISYNTQTLKIKKVKENAIIPTLGSAEAAGIDLYACIDEPMVVMPGEQVMFGSGIACEFPPGYFGAVVPRSSVGIKKGLNIPQGLAVIDADYTGEILLAFHNHTKNVVVITPNERLAQMILLPYVNVNIEEVNEIRNTERGDGGIGSTGQF